MAGGVDGQLRPLAQLQELLVRVDVDAAETIQTFREMRARGEDEADACFRDEQAAGVTH